MKLKKVYRNWYGSSRLKNHVLFAVVAHIIWSTCRLYLRALPGINANMIPALFKRLLSRFYSSYEPFFRLIGCMRLHAEL